MLYGFEDIFSRTFRKFGLKRLLPPHKLTILGVAPKYYLYSLRPPKGTSLRKTRHFKVHASYGRIRSSDLSPTNTGDQSAANVRRSRLFIYTKYQALCRCVNKRINFTQSTNFYRAMHFSAFARSCDRMSSVRL